MLEILPYNEGKDKWRFGTMEYGLPRRFNEEFFAATTAKHVRTRQALCSMLFSLSKQKKQHARHRGISRACFHIV